MLADFIAILSATTAIFMMRALVERQLECYESLHPEVDDTGTEAMLA